MTPRSDLARYYRLSPADIERSATPGWWLAGPCQGRRGGCKHFEHAEPFSRGRLRHLIRYDERGAA